MDIKKIQIVSEQKSLKQWFKEKWVDISRPKKGGGFEPCGRDDAAKGEYPKCVPASKASKMSAEDIRSAISRKRRAESTQTRVDKKPIYVSTEKDETKSFELEGKAAIPTNPELYARVKAEAKTKFDVYPSAYANAWLVREYKKRGGGYRSEKSDDGDYEESIDDLTEMQLSDFYDWLDETIENPTPTEKKMQTKWHNITGLRIKADDSCPVATKDIAVNLKNRGNAIKSAMYGPLNPSEPNEEYWNTIAKEWDVDTTSAKKQRCGNCVMFVVTPKMKDCINSGVTGGERQDEWAAIDSAGQLGYCEAFDFKCAAQRTCRAWVVGGPITSDKQDKKRTD